MKNKKIQNKDWREGLQKESVVKWVKYINAAVVVVTAAVLVLTFAGFALAMAFSAVLWVLSVVLITVLPLYFSPVLGRERRRVGCKTKTVDLTFPLVMAPLTFFLNFKDDFTIATSNGRLLLFAMALVATATFILLMYLYCKDFGENLRATIGVFLLSGLLFYGAVGYINHYAKPNKYYEECTVTELIEYSGAKLISHRCFVKFKDGSIKRVKIKTDDFRKIYKGATVYVYRGGGALGIRYYHLKLCE